MGKMVVCAGVFFFLPEARDSLARRGIGDARCDWGSRGRGGRLKIKNAKGKEPKGESILAWASLEMTRQVEASGSSGNSVVGFSQPSRRCNWLAQDKLRGQGRDQETYLLSMGGFRWFTF